VPGGSSSGSASACASGACDIAIGSDTAGSVRIPAAFCGLYGIRVSSGRIDLAGAMAMAPSFDASGWFAASPGVFALPGPVLLNGWDSSAEAGIRGASILTDAFANADRRAADLCLAFLKVAGDHLPAAREITIAGDKIDTWREALRVTQASEVWKTFGSFVSKGNIDFGPGIAERMKTAASIEDAEVARSKSVLNDVTRRLEDATANGTVLILPTGPSIAPSIAATPDELERFRVNTMRLVCMASISGLPQMTIPIGTVDGAPFGLSFIGWRNGEEALLTLATRLGRFVGGCA
jgi:amidase